MPVAAVNQAQLNTLKAQISSTKKELDLAEAALKSKGDQINNVDSNIADQDLLKAESEYRAAVNKSQLHSYTSMITGKAVAQVTEAEVKNLEK